MRERRGPRHFPALFALAALLLLAGPAASQSASLASGSREGSATDPLSTGASGNGVAAPFQANSHLLLHGEVLLGAAMFLPPGATPRQRTATSSAAAGQQPDPAEEGAPPAAAAAAPAVHSATGGTAAPATPDATQDPPADPPPASAPNLHEDDDTWGQGSLAALAASAAAATAAATSGRGLSLVASVRRGGLVVARAQETITPTAVAAALRRAAAAAEATALAAARGSQPHVAAAAAPHETAAARLPYTFLMPVAGSHQAEEGEAEGGGAGGGFQVLLVLELPPLPGTGGRTSAFVASGDSSGGLELRLTLDASAPHLAAFWGPPPPTTPTPTPPPLQLEPAAARHWPRAAAAAHGGPSPGVDVAELTHLAAAAGLTAAPPGLSTPWHAASLGAGTLVTSSPAAAAVSHGGAGDGELAAAMARVPPQWHQDSGIFAAQEQQCVAAVCHHWAHMQQLQQQHGERGEAPRGHVSEGPVPGRSCPPPPQLLLLPNTLSRIGSSSRPGLDPQSQCPALVIATLSLSGVGVGPDAVSGGGGTPHEQRLPPRLRQQQGQGQPRPASSAAAGAGGELQRESRARGAGDGTDGSGPRKPSSMPDADATAVDVASAESSGTGTTWWAGLACGAVAGVLATAAAAAAVAAVVSGRGCRNSRFDALEVEHLVGPGAEAGGPNHQEGAGYGEAAYGTQQHQQHQHQHQQQHLQQCFHVQQGLEHSSGDVHGADGGGSPARAGPSGGLLQRTASGLGSLLSTPLRRARLAAAGRYAPADSPIAEEGGGGFEYGSGAGAGGAMTVAAAGGMLEGSGEARGGGGGGGGTGGTGGSILRWRRQEGAAAGEVGAVGMEGEEGDGAAFLAELEAAGGGAGGGGGGGFASTLAQLSPSVLKLLAAGRSATGSWGRDEQGRLRRFSARTTRILNSILASSSSGAGAGAGAAAPPPGAAAGGGALAGPGDVAGAGVGFSGGDSSAAAD